MEKENQIKVNIKQFFRGLTQVLSIFENKNFKYIIKNDSDYGDNDDEQNLIWNEENYNIHLVCLEDENLFRYTKLISSITRIENEDKVDRIKYDANYEDFNKIKLAISPLISIYPYLSYFIDQIENVCSKNNGNITATQILLLARDYINNNIKTDNDKCKKFSRIITCMAKNEKK
ncbi:MAG: hypothetical protein HFI86_00970 [Bacilli bacterium]|nr:hypothetical protein [Bacilli bacterium]